jgi:hypothetical protein
MECARLDPFFAALLKQLEERRGSVLVLAPWSQVFFEGHLPGDLAALTEAVRHRRGQRFPISTTYPITDSEALRVDQGDTLTLERVSARFNALNPGMGRHVSDLVRNQATLQVAEERGRRGDTFQAMRIGFAWLWKQPGRHTVLLVTTGFPHEPSDPGFNEMMNHSLRVNAPVHFLAVAPAKTFATFEGIEDRYALDEGATGVGGPADESGLGQAVRRDFGLSSGGHENAAVLAFMVFLLAYTPCVATLAAQRREIGVRWAAFGVGVQLTVAWTLAVLVFQLGRLLG